MWFFSPCREAFGFLETRYGFGSPKVEQIGRECFVTFRKRDRWVSIAYEPGSIPIVELFHPTADIKDRRIPHLCTGVADRKQFASWDEAHHRQVLQSQAADLEEKERSFLAAA